MEYWVAMNEEELKLSFALLGRKGLSGIIEIDPKYTPKETIAKSMFEKQFFRKDDEGSTWSPFVQMVLTCALDSQSELRIESSSEFVCSLFFYYETIVLLVRDKNNELYIFYYIPLIPEAIGSVAKILENLQNEMSVGKLNLDVTLPLRFDPETKDYLLEYLYDNKEYFTAGEITVRMFINGWQNGENLLKEVLIQTQEGFCLATIEEDNIRITSVDYYQLIEDLARSIINAHGRLLRKAGRDNDSH